MTEHTDILIIGGGISGLLTAREFRLAGLDVTVVDQSALGQESSWAGGGILLPIYPWRQDAAISELVLASLALYPDLSRELFDATGIDPELRHCGMLITKNPDIDAARLWCRNYGIRYQAADSSLLAPLNCSLEQPLWLPDIAQARNPRLLKSLKAFLLQAGVSFIEHAQITHLEIEQQRIQRVQVNDTSFTADQVILCAGAWSEQFLRRWLPDCGLQLEIQPVRGQMLLLDARPETLSHMILDGDHYLIPRKDGKILVGSTVEEVGFEKNTTDAIRQELHQFAIDLFPELKKFPVCNHWAGLRPGTPRGVPYIGPHPEITNFSINAGHFRNGLVMGPASARLLADLILQRPTTVAPAAYAPGRTIS